MVRYSRVLSLQPFADTMSSMSSIFVCLNTESIHGINRSLQWLYVGITIEYFIKVPLYYIAKPTYGNI